MKKVTNTDYDFIEKNKDGWFYSNNHPRVRFKFIREDDPIFGGTTNDFFFEIFKRPYFFGLLGKKKWEFIVQTNGWMEGMSFCNYILRK